MKSLELLPNKNYLLELEEEEMDWGYQYLNDIYDNLKKHFPESKFIIMTKGLDTKELSDKEIDRLITILNNLKKERENE